MEGKERKEERHGCSRMDSARSAGAFAELTTSSSCGLGGTVRTDNILSQSGVL
jgi:hypothetical protein